MRSDKCRMASAGFRANGFRRVAGFSTLFSVLCGMNMIFTSCDVHQFPEPKVEPDVPEVTVKVPLRLVYDADIYIWEHYYDPLTGRLGEQYPESNVFPEYPGTTEKYDNTQQSGVLDIHVKVFRKPTGKLVKEQEFTMTLSGDSYNTDLELELPEDTQYTIAVWSHLRENKEDNPFYDTSDFNKVGLISNNYKGNTDYRDGFSGKTEIDTYGEFVEPKIVDMTRPMGKFEFVTLDLSEFLDRETTRRAMSSRATADEYIVVVSFPFYFPTSYSVLDDRLENSQGGISFKTHMTVTGESEASLGFEYVLLNNINDGGVQTRVDIYDPDMVHVAGSTTLTLPMKRDCHTLLRGRFLSQDNEGGVGIDPDFDGDFNITM